MEKVLKIADKELRRHRTFQSNCRIREITTLRHTKKKSLIPEGKEKTVLVHVVNAYGGVGGMAPLSHNLDNRWRWSKKKFVI